MSKCARHQGRGRAPKDCPYCNRIKAREAAERETAERMNAGIIGNLAPAKIASYEKELPKAALPPTPIQTSRAKVVNESVRRIKGDADWPQMKFTPHPFIPPANYPTHGWCSLVIDGVACTAPKDSAVHVGEAK